VRNVNTYRGDEEGLEQGANLAMLGREMIQFREAEPIRAGSFRLSGLRRAIGGSANVPDRHGAGEFFVLLDPGTIKVITLPAWAGASTITAETCAPSGQTSCAALRLEGSGNQQKQRKEQAFQ
jgi:hypothetical protein